MKVWNQYFLWTLQHKNNKLSSSKPFYLLKIGVSCDNCMKSNFSGKRYKCLICYDFDLCSNCYDQSQCQLSSNTPFSQGTVDTKQNKSSSSKSTVNQPVSNSIQISQTSHLNTHAMQCILTRSDHELFYGSGGAGIIDFTIGKYDICSTQSSNRYNLQKFFVYVQFKILYSMKYFIIPQQNIFILIQFAQIYKMSRPKKFLTA